MVTNESTSGAPSAAEQGYYGVVLGQNPLCRVAKGGSVAMLGPGSRTR